MKGEICYQWSEKRVGSGRKVALFACRGAFRRLATRCVCCMQNSRDLCRPKGTCVVAPTSYCGKKRPRRRHAIVHSASCVFFFFLVFFFVPPACRRRDDSKTWYSLCERFDSRRTFSNGNVVFREAKTCLLESSRVPNWFVSEWKRDTGLLQRSRRIEML